MSKKHWFGEELNRLRTLRRMSYDDLSRASGISRGALWKLRTNPNPNPTLKTILAICKALCVTTEDFFRGSIVTEVDDDE